MIGLPLILTLIALCIFGVAAIAVALLGDRADNRMAIQEWEAKIRAGICPECGCNETMNSEIETDLWGRAHYLWCPRCDASVATDINESEDSDAH